MIFNFVNGSGIGLNFKIIGGTTEPISTSENTIWFNTDTEITGWEFSAANSNTLETGGIWIQTGTVANIKFNALKKNTLMVYPIKAEQLIEGNWIDISFKIYQNGEWIEPITYLFVNGNRCDDITGGWYGIADTATTLTGRNYDDSGTATSGVNRKTYTINTIDLSAYNMLTVTVLEAGTTYFSVWVQNDAGTKLAETTVNEKIESKTDVTLDISNVNEACHIYLYVYGHDAGNAGAGTSYANAYFDVSEVRLE